MKQLRMRNSTKVQEETALLGVSTKNRSIDEFLEEAYETKGGKWRYWMIMVSLGIGISSDAAEVLCLSYFLATPGFQRDILDNSPVRGGVLASSVFFGMLVGGLLAGILGDKLGRRPILWTALFCNVTAGWFSSISQTLLQLCFLRGLSGVGIGATVPPTLALATELSPPSQRGFFVTFCTSFFMMGSVYAALVALLVLEHLRWNWRCFAIAASIPSFVGAILVGTLVVESPRLVALQQRPQEATRIANQLAQRMNFRGLPLQTTEVLQHFPASSRSKKNASDASTLLAIRHAFGDLIRSTRNLYHPQMRYTTSPLQLAWFSINFGSYGITTWINTLFAAVQLENIYYNALLFALSSLPGNLVSVLWMDRVGRKSMLVGSFLGAALSLVSFAGFTWEEEGLHKTGIVGSACLFQAFITASWNALECTTSEVFPTTVRSTGMGICNATGRVGAMAAQLVNGALLANPVRLILVASTALFVGALTPYLLQSGEMSRQPLLDKVLDSDGESSSRADEDDGDGLP